MILSNSRHDHNRNFVVLFRKKLRNSYAVAPGAPAIVFFSLCPRAGIWQRLRCVLPVENPLLANMSQQRTERNQFKDFGGVRRGKTSVADRAWISKPKLHDTHVSLISDLFKEHIHLHESSTASSAFFQIRHTLQVKNARSKSWGAAHERTNAVSSVFMLIGETAATGADVG